MAAGAADVAMICFMFWVPAVCQVWCVTVMIDPAALLHSLQAAVRTGMLDSVRFGYC
ncbi:MAG: hypothetical protein Tsb0027_05130 [Wenzhouxiangellaceae bacterium]